MQSRRRHKLKLTDLGHELLVYLLNEGFDNAYDVVQLTLCCRAMNEAVKSSKWTPFSSAPIVRPNGGYDPPNGGYDVTCDPRGGWNSLTNALQSCPLGGTIYLEHGSYSCRQANLIDSPYGLCGLYISKKVHIFSDEAVLCLPNLRTGKQQIALVISDAAEASINGVNCRIAPGPGTTHGFLIAAGALRLSELCVQNESTSIQSSAVCVCPSARPVLEELKLECRGGSAADYSGGGGSIVGCALINSNIGLFIRKNAGAEPTCMSSRICGCRVGLVIGMDVDTDYDVGRVRYWDRYWDCNDADCHDQRSKQIRNSGAARFG